MLRKILLTTIITAGIGMSAQSVSANIVNSTTGIDLTKKTDIKPVYQLAYANLSDTDYKIEIVKNDNDFDQNNLGKTINMPDNNQISNAKTNPYTATLSLTDSGRQKIAKALHVPADATMIIQGVFNPDDKTPDRYLSTIALQDDKMPTVKNVFVVADKIDDAKVVSSNNGLKSAIKETKTKQQTAQKQLGQNDGSSLVKDARGNLGSGVDINPSVINQQAVDRAEAGNKKAFDAAMRDQKLAKTKTIVLRLVGVGLLVGMGVLTAFGIYKFRSRKKNLK